MIHAALAWAILIVCTAATVSVALRRISVPISVSLLIAGVLRIDYAVLTSHQFTPRDVTVYFHSTGQLVLQGRDPLDVLPGRQWNFLELMPYIHALEIKTGLPWVYAVKIAPIIADVIVVWLVSQLATRDAHSRALQYALNPLSLLIVSLHGQVEPVALALALGGILLLRRERPVFAGLLLGAAVAAKTWPILILVAVLPWSQPRRAAQIVAGSAVVPIACLASASLWLHAAPIRGLKHLVSYSSFVGGWTWSGALASAGVPGIVGYDSRVARLGTILVVIAVAIALVLFRRQSPEVRASVCVSSALLVTAGFGTQYLLWPLPLLFLLGNDRRLQYTLAATAFAGFNYLMHWPQGVSYSRGMSWLVASMLAASLWQEWRAANSPPMARPPAQRHGRARHGA